MAENLFLMDMGVANDSTPPGHANVSIRKWPVSDYSKLGFTPVGGNVEDNWVILRNGEHVIGLFQDMFDKNMLTFNPGWDQQGNETGSFTDVREIQKKLKESGISLASEANEDSQGPAGLMVIDPDGNPILVDQHR